MVVINPNRKPSRRWIVRGVTKDQGVANEADTLAKGMADKAREFREQGRELYSLATFAPPIA